MKLRGFLGTGLIVVAALAQTQPPAQVAPDQTAAPKQPEVVLKATTRLVQVSVIVQKHGEPVADLKKEDFQLRENGKVQKIDLFNVEATNKAMLPKAAAPLPPGIYTNELAQRPGTPASVTIILLDNNNTNLERQMYARQQVLKYLQTIKPEDRIGIYRLGGGLKVLHSYTTDSADLVALLANYKGKDIPDLSKNATGALDGEMVQINQFFNPPGASGMEHDFYTIDRVKGTLKAIEFIANNLSSLPGRKNLIWVSGGFPNQINLLNFKDSTRIQADFTPEIRSCIRAMNNANLSIYPVDSRALMTDPRFSAEHQKIDTRPNMKAPIGVNNQETMEELASGTGGHAYYNTNDLKKAIGDAVDDSRVVYTLGFYPSDEAFDGKFHKLEVKVTDQSGLSLRYRKGYFDSPQTPVDTQTAMTELKDAVWSPLDSTALGLIIAAKADPKNPTQLNMAVEVEPKSISLEPQGDRWAGRLDILFIQKNDKGQQFDGVDETVSLNLTRENYDKLIQHGFVFRKSVNMAAQAKMVRVIVRDAPSGAMGSVTIPFNQLTH
jgi:VWFA-related protein